MNTRQLMLQSSTFRTTVSEAAIALSVPTDTEFVKLETTGLLSPSSITMTATAYNISNPGYLWEYRNNDPTVTTWTSIGGGSTLVLTNTAFENYRTANLTVGTQVTFRVTCFDTVNTDTKSSTATQVITYSDEATDAIDISASAPNVLIQCNSNGTPNNLDNTGLKIQVSRNGKLLKYAATGKNTWSIGTPVVVPANLTLGTGTISLDTLTYTFANIADITADEVLVTFPITIKNGIGINGQDRPVRNLVQKFVKVRAGVSALSVSLTNDSHAVPSNSDGSSPTLTNSGTDIYVYDGGAQLDYDGIGTANGKWTVVISSSAGVTPGSTIIDGGTYARVSDLQAMSGDTGYINYTITGKTTTGISFTFVKTQTFSKNRGGQAAVWYNIVSSTPAVYKDSSAFNINGAFSPITVSGYKNVGSTSSLYGWLKITPFINGTAQTPGYIYRQYNSTPASTDQSTSWTITLHDNDNPSATPAQINSAAVLDTEEIRTVFKGNTGTPGNPGSNGKTYELTITGGIRSFTYDKDGLFPIPAPTQYSVTLTEDGTSVTPATYSWSTGGQLSSTGTSSTFTPVVATSFSGTNTFVQCTVTYAGSTITRTIPISINRIGSPGNNGKTYELTITGGIRSFTYDQAGANPTPAATAYSVTLTEDGVAVTPSSYAWTTGGQLSSTSAAATFTPTVAGAFIASNNTFIQCTTVYAGVSVTRTIPIAINRTGSTGSKTVQISAYQWSSTGLPALPTTSFSYNWSTGVKNPSTLDGGWSFTAIAPTATNQTLYEIVKTVTEINGEAASTTNITFSGASSNSIGFRQDGTIGSSVKTATTYIYYQTAQATSAGIVDPVFGANPYNFTTGALTFGTANGWAQTPPTFQAGTTANNYWYKLITISQTDSGTQVVTQGTTLLGTSFTNLVTFTSLSTSGSTAIDGGNITTGTINAQRITTTNLSAINSNLGLVNIGASGSSLGYVKTLGRNYGDVAAGFFLGYDSTAYKFEISNSDRSKLLQFDTGGNLQIRGVDIFGGQTAYNTGTGFFLGSSGSFSVGTGPNSLRFDGTTLTVPAVNITGTIPSTVTHSGDVTGTLNSTAVGTVVSGASNGATAFTGTAAYRNNAAPTNNATLGTITQANTSDGNIVVTVPYTYTQGAVVADSLIVFYKEGGGTVAAADPAFITNAVGGSITFTLKPGTTYSFGIQAVRRTESGLVGTTINSSGNLTTNAANFTGNIDNVAASTVRSGAADGTSALSAVNNGSTGLSAKLNKAAADTLSSTITLNSTGTVLVGTANDGVYIDGTNGLLAKKSGLTTFQITTAGDATFYGTVSVGSTIPVITGTTISSGAGALITSTGNFAVGNTTTNMVWNGTNLSVKGGFRIDQEQGYINVRNSLIGTILEIDDNSVVYTNPVAVRITSRNAGATGLSVSTTGASAKSILLSASGSGTTFGVDSSVSSTSGTGVRGTASASTGTTYGVQGTSSSSSGIGVDGTGGSRGVVGTCNTNAFAGQGVRGVGTGNSTQGSTGVLATSPYMALEVSGPSYFSGGNIQILANTFFKTGYSYSFENVQGTAPFAVTSTTKVANLQADSVDGLEIVGVATAGTGTANFGNTTKPTATVTSNVWLQVTHNGTTYYIPAWT